jgi:hypothetical protein
LNAPLHLQAQEICGEGRKAADQAANHCC